MLFSVILQSKTSAFVTSITSFLITKQSRNVISFVIYKNFDFYMVDTLPYFLVTGVKTKHVSRQLQCDVQIQSCRVICPRLRNAEYRSFYCICHNSI